MISRIEVAVVDDDKEVRESMRFLLLAAGYTPRLYASAKDFLENVDTATRCAIVDLQMPEMSGLELQQSLIVRDMNLPIIFVTGHGDIPLAVRALRAGASDFIEKPFGSLAMLDSISRALKAGDQSSGDFTKVRDAKTKLALLTPREQGVITLLAKGRSTKAAAYELGISSRTVEVHRAKIMRKLSARNIVDVMRVYMTAA